MFLLSVSRFSGINDADDDDDDDDDGQVDGAFVYCCPHYSLVSASVHCYIAVLEFFICFFFSRSIKSRSIMLMRGKWEILLVDYFLVKTKIK